MKDDHLPRFLRAASALMLISSVAVAGCVAGDPDDPSEDATLAGEESGEAGSQAAAADGASSSSEPSQARMCDNPFFCAFCPGVCTVDPADNDCACSTPCAPTACSCPTGQACVKTGPNGACGCRSVILQ